MFRRYYQKQDQGKRVYVDFSGLTYWGQKYNFDFTGFTDQFSFLKGLGIISLIRKMEMKNQPAGKQNEIVNLLRTFLFDMGKKFKVLLLQKQVAPVKLSGLQFTPFMI